MIKIQPDKKDFFLALLKEFAFVEVAEMFTDAEEKDSNFAKNTNTEVKKITPEPEAWKRLFGAWKDMEEDIVETVRANRLPEREVPNFDI